MQASNFNIVDIANELQQQWKRIGWFVIISLLVTVITLFIVPKYYKAVAVVLPANPTLADKGRLFNNNIQGLYSFLGNGDDVETLAGIARLDTVFYTIVDDFNLVKYYKSKGKTLAAKRRNALKDLRDDLVIEKNENNQLTITAWTKYDTLSANIANTLIEEINKIEKNIWQKSYTDAEATIQLNISTTEKLIFALTDSIKQLKKDDTKAVILSNKQMQLQNQYLAYLQKADELKIALATTPPSLYVIQKASPPAIADKPAKIQILVAVGFISVVFGCLITLLFAKNK